MLPPDATATIYTFGLSLDDGEFTGFAYRSTSDFEAEQLQHGIGVKPAPESGMIGEINGLADFAKLAFSQQEEDRKLPRLKRVGIGGKLWMYTMLKDENGSLALRIESLGDMPYADDDHELILAQTPAECRASSVVDRVGARPLGPLGILPSIAPGHLMDQQRYPCRLSFSHRCCPAR